MKTAGYFLIAIWTLTLFHANCAHAQKFTEKTQIPAADRATLVCAIDSREFVFTERMFTTSPINFQHLAPFSLLLDSEILTTDLPDFSSAYNLNVSNAQGKLPLRTTAFAYKVKAGKKDGWDIRITSRKYGTGRAEIYMHVASNGYTIVSVRSEFGGIVNYVGMVAPATIQDESASR